ncbi:hypothetical protein BLSTO_06572 [Blastocystis sp. subtype 1]
MEDKEGTSIIYVWSDGDDNEKAKEIADKLAYNFLIDASVHFYAYKYSDAGDVQQLHPFISSPLPTFLAISNGEIAQYQYEKVTMMMTMTRRKRKRKKKKRRKKRRPQRWFARR